MRRSLTAALRAVPLILGAALAACEVDGGQGDDDSAEAPPKPVVRVEKAALGAVAAVVESSATVESDVRADLQVEVAGTVREVRAEEGDRVARGQVLAVLDNPALTGALRRAEVEARQRARELERLRPLHGSGFISEAEWDLALKAQEAADLALGEARDQLAAATIEAPVAGTVTARGLRLGEAVAPGQPAWSVADLDRLVVEVRLPERDLGRVRVGQAARLRSETLAGVEVPARVLRLSPVVDPKSGTVKVTLAVEAGKAGSLRPGMLVRAGIVTETREEAVLIPKKAVVYEEGLPYAWKVRDGKVARVALDLGHEDGDRVEVRGGFQAGDTAVVVGQGSLKDGAEVDLAGPDGMAPPAAAGKAAPAPAAADATGGKG